MNGQLIRDQTINSMVSHTLAEIDTLWTHEKHVCDCLPDAVGDKVDCNCAYVRPSFDCIGSSKIGTVSHLP